MSYDELRPVSVPRRAAAFALRPRGRACGVAVFLTFVAAGCSVGTGAPVTSTRLLVTQDFGTRSDTELDTPKGRSGDTALRVLEQNARVRADARGVVRSVDGQAVGRSPGRPDGWELYVNGVAPERGAAATKVRDGERLWFDRHGTSAARRVAAVVGSFPEPFLHGYDGNRLPTRLECTEPRTPGCTRVGKRLAEVGVVAGKGGLQTSLSRETNRVIVGLWPAIRNDEAVRNLENGPVASGVFARPAADGRTLAILDEEGRVARTLGPGSGLIAATRYENGRPVWLVTGTDEAGLVAAADALQEGDLGGHFALAVSDGQAVDVPLVKRAPSAG